MPKLRRLEMITPGLSVIHRKSGVRGSIDSLWWCRGAGIQFSVMWRGYRGRKLPKWYGEKVMENCASMNQLGWKEPFDVKR